MRVILPWLLAAASAAAAPIDQLSPTSVPFHDAGPVRASVEADRTLVQSGQAVWVTFRLTNVSSEPVTLKVPDVPAVESTSLEMGLPLSHVFSGPRYNALSIRDDRREEWDTQVSFRPRGPLPIIRLAPYGSVGVRVDLAQYYLSMKRPGKYVLIWRPYFAAVESPPLQLTILAERQAVILTEFGSMVMRFYYDEAPGTVQNFFELVEKRFYNRLRFHKIIPHVLIQGGDPRGDGRGGRPDGKRIKAEFSRIPFVRGTVGMARLPSDPDSASSQFFITASRQAGLDGNQTAFGYLVGEESFRTLDTIASLPTDENGRPRDPVAIRAIYLENVPGRDPDIGGLDPLSPPPASRPAIMGGAVRAPMGTEAPGPATRPAFGTGG